MKPEGNVTWARGLQKGISAFGHQFYYKITDTESTVGAHLPEPWVAVERMWAPGYAHPRLPQEAIWPGHTLAGFLCGSVITGGMCTAQGLERRMVTRFY